MARAEANWERLVRAALRGDRMGGVYGVPASGIAGNVPSSLGNNTHIDEVLRAADEIQDEDPTVARILCEHAYTLAQSLDPNSEGRGVLQFKTGLMSVIRQKLAKREGAAIDRSQDVAKLQEFYKLYREKHKVDELCEDEMKLRESAVFSGNLGELERKTLKRKKVLATLKVLWLVIEDITREISPEDADKYISEEMKKVMQKDAARTEDVAYNIIPLDALSTTNAIVTFPEVRAAISALQYHRDLPRLPSTVSVPDARNSDMLDLLHCVFGFQFQRAGCPTPGVSGSGQPAEAQPGERPAGGSVAAGCGKPADAQQKQVPAGGASGWRSRPVDSCQPVAACSGSWPVNCSRTVRLPEPAVAHSGACPGVEVDSRLEAAGGVPPGKYVSRERVAPGRDVPGWW